MQQHRIERLNKLLFQNILNIVHYELHDSRVQEVNIEYVIVSPDMRDATVYFSLPDESKKLEALDGLNKTSNVIRKRLADSINLRYTPRLHFKFDTNEQRAQIVEGVIEKDRYRYES
ncbi:MAG: 30S ribosome-binding factor RbfA [Candidatus Cloacimonetes bacterium]|nr:30S ribosome-binding factor RbfA [Candidatus Cloacimonadota bacterium]